MTKKKGKFPRPIIDEPIKTKICPECGGKTFDDGKEVCCLTCGLVVCATELFSLGNLVIEDN